VRSACRKSISAYLLISLYHRTPAFLSLRNSRSPDWHRDPCWSCRSRSLARTVLRRRLASSTQAIAESIRRRLEKQEGLLEELESLSPPQRARRLAQIQGRLTDVEQDEDDLDDEQRDLLTDGFTTAIELDQLRAEITVLRDLLAQARRVRDNATDSKLTALRDCLAKAEFNELKDGRGRLLIFTEHRDTLNHLLDHLTRWGYSTCQIHGGTQRASNSVSVVFTASA